MNLFRARVREPNVIGNNFGVEKDSTYQDPIAIRATPTSTYRPGDEVLCAELEDGTSVIVGNVPAEFRRLGKSFREKIAGRTLDLGSTPESKLVLNSRFSRVGEYSSSGIEVPELLPGDNHMASSTGNSVKALSGGVNIMDSGRARVTTNGATGAVDIDCESFNLTSGMGLLSISPDESGGFSLNFRGNVNPGQSNRNSNSGSNSDFSSTFKIGSEVEAMTSDGFGIRVDADGTIVLNGTSVYVQTEDALVPLYEPSFEEQRDIFSDSTELIGSNSLKLTSEGNREDATTGDKLENIGKQLIVSISGPSAANNSDVLTNPANVYGKQEQVLSGGSKVTIGTPLSGGGKYRVDSYGDIHMSGNSSNRGGAAVVIDPSSARNPVAHGLWTSVNTAKTHLHTALLPSTPATVGDGLPNAWAALPPLPGGINPLCTGYVKYSHYFLGWSGVLASLQAVTTALAEIQTNAPAKPMLQTATSLLAARMATFPLEETKTSYINEI